MKLTRYTRVAALLLAAALAACSDQPAATPQGPDPLVDLLVQMGFARDQIVDSGDHFTVEGDMLIAKSSLRAPAPAGGPVQPAGPSLQRYSSVIAANRRTIRVDLSQVDAQNASWAGAVRTAISNWNAAAGTGYWLMEGSPADVTVTIANLGQCTAASAYLPSGGAPGHTLYINSVYLGTYTPAQMAFVVTHEMGHVLGLTHTDQWDYNKVSGTPDSDGASVMNSGSTYGGCPPAAPSTSTPSYWDQTAARYLYPATLTASVAYPGGTPTVSWNAINGATSYEVYYVTEQVEVGTGAVQTQSQFVGSTTSTSRADPYRSYTGVSMCETRGTVQGGLEEYYYYRVYAYHGGGSLTRLVDAETGTC